MQQERNLLWYAKGLGLTHLVSQRESVMQTANEQGWNLEQTLHVLLQGEYERRLAERQKARIRTAEFDNLKYLEQLDRNELPD